MKTMTKNAASLLALFCSMQVLPAAASTDISMYAESYRKELATDAIANSTSNAVQSATTSARSSKSCTDLKASAKAAAEQSVRNHLPPDPTKVIEKSTCFVSVAKIKIPATGYGFADAIVSGLLGMMENGCANSTNSWTAIVNAANVGNISGLSNMQVLQAIQSGNTSQIVTAAAQQSGNTNVQAVVRNVPTQELINAATQSSGGQSPAQQIVNSLLNSFQ